MALKIINTEFVDLFSENIVRSNPRTLLLKQEINSLVKSSTKKFIILKKVFTLQSGFAFKSSDYIQNDGVPLIRIGDVGNNFSPDNMVYLPDYYAEEYNKYLLETDDIIVSLTGDGRIKSDKVIESNKYLLNQRVGALRPIKNINVEFYYALIQNYPLIKKQFRYFSNGKTQLNISPTDFLNIKIPLLTDNVQNQIIKTIRPLQENINQLKSSIKPQHEIINEVFAREFGFNMDLFYDYCSEKRYELDFNSFGKNVDLRQSVKFHRNAGKFVIEELTKISKSKIKNFISEPIVLGTSVSPADYDENGEFYYVSMANIKNWKFESDGAKLVSDNYSSLISKKLKVGDILLARSGEGTIGKVALIDEDVQGVFADFTMRIRLKNYNTQFAYYYFRTVYFQYLVEINKKGLGNNTNIFPSQLQELPIIDITLERQQEIVDEIKKEIDSQNVYLEQIEVARKQIEEIIEKAISI